jgi:hypothetical protein
MNIMPAYGERLKQKSKDDFSKVLAEISERIGRKIEKVPHKTIQKTPVIKTSEKSMMAARAVAERLRQCLNKGDIGRWA